MITQNIMCACSFDMRFTFVYAGWEGSAHDARVLDAARTNDNLGFPHPPSGKYYIVDSGYASQLGYLVPFRGQRYPLQDYGEGRPGPRTAKELFNHRHSSLRNVIERTFGVLKNRFHILKSMKAYDIEDQSRIVVACCGLHNYIKEQAIQDQLFNELGSEQQIDDPMNPDTPAYHASASDVSQRLSARQMSIMRLNIANQLAISRRMSTISLNRS
ncbi:putative nuclease HARBI1 [Macadamia integrifolia]|uniref:putative nuclease HARBI1 n=1 Tax=Macadamia integrifolia TaxID=60698 RepID=UPI001C52EA65|nr:putative nuclease HARBI1 [Macadamia integrifolia]